MATASSKKNATGSKALAPVKKPAAVKPATVKPAAPVKAKPAVKTATAKAPAKTAAPAPVKNGKAVEVLKEKIKKPKLVRDSFTMPEAEYAVLGQVKKACIAAGIEVKKSQLLRIGLVLLSQAEVGTLKKMIAALAPLKAGRPKKEK